MKHSYHVTHRAPTLTPGFRNTCRTATATKKPFPLERAAPTAPPRRTAQQTTPTMSRGNASKSSVSTSPSRMAQASHGAPSPPAALSSATPRSRLSRQALGSVEGQYPSARTLQPTTGSESLLVRHLNADPVPREEQGESLRQDELRTQSPPAMRWLIGQEEDRWESTTQSSSRRTHSPVQNAETLSCRTLRLHRVCRRTSPAVEQRRARNRHQTTWTRQQQPP